METSTNEWPTCKDCGRGFEYTFVRGLGGAWFRRCGCGKPPTFGIDSFEWPTNRPVEVG